MVITGLSHWHFFSWCPGMQSLHVVVGRDDYTAKVAEAMDRFTREYKELRERMIPKLQLTLPPARDEAA
jgi:hypothetical protein